MKTIRPTICEHEWAWFNRSGMYSCNKCHEWSYLGNHSNVQVATESTPKPRAGVSVEKIKEMIIRSEGLFKLSEKERERLAQAIHKLLEEGNE